MIDFIESVVEAMLFMLICLCIIAVVIYGCCLVFEKTNLQERMRIKQEWQQKVNDCVLNENCRTDCKLILYRDAQIHNCKIEQKQQANVMTSAMVGSMIGSSFK